MINKSDAYKAAIAGDTRRMRVQALVDIVDPEMVREGVETSPADPYSAPTEIYDRDFTSATVRASLEPGRWMLNGATPLYPDDPADMDGVKDYTSEAMCGADCVFETPQQVAVKMSNCDILQTATVAFSDNAADPFPVEFTCEVYSSGGLAATVEITDNTERVVGIYGFTVYDPRKVVIKAAKMSKPYSRLRVVELVPGTYETWGGDEIQSISITQQAAVSMTRLPYTTCKLVAYNKDNRFSPVEEDGVFLSLQDGEPIIVKIGVGLPDGSTDWTQVGLYYQKTAGWSLPSMGLTVTWNLVDIVGLIANRKYVVPETLPTTVNGWLASIVSQLGTVFAGKYSVPEGVGDKSLTATAEELEGITCGALLRSIALATDTYCRADTQTGYLGLFKRAARGDTLVDFDALNDYPTLSANEGCAQVIFSVTTKDAVSGNETTEQYAYPGTNATSDKTISLDDMFLPDDTARQKAVRQVVEEYGGNKITCKWRGDPSIEAGDIVNLQLTDTVVQSARLLKQEFSFKDGVMTNLKAELIQGSGVKNYANRTVIAESGTYTVPDGITEIYVIIVGGGDSGFGGWIGGVSAENETDPGWWDEVGTGWFRAMDGAAGDPGAGGNVFYATLQVTPGQTFAVGIGAGGVATGEANPYVNAPGTDTTFGAYSSAAGAKYPLGFADISAGVTLAPQGAQVYQLSDVTNIRVTEDKTSYGAGGSGGRGGTGAYNAYSKDVDPTSQYAGKVVVPPTKGQLGLPGVQGCVIIYDTEVTA